jgi:hypothetical protein
LFCCSSRAPPARFSVPWIQPTIAVLCLTGR